jgi:DNA invertase Pin-like site-specific DNA recombinase
LVKRTRVAAYARVSSGKDAMLHSLSSQINHYKKFIHANSEWVFVGVYADEANTGTKDSRAEFQQLLIDSRHGKIDMIITKSISRFARNTATLLKTVRELKELKVDVFFEEQNIHSISGEGEMILTFLAVFAQEESRSVSENMKWRINKDFEQGIMWGGKSHLGYKLENRKLTVVPEEAEIVQMIYQLYIDGNGDQTICKILERDGIKPYIGKRWNTSSVYNILNNYNYTGDLILQKTYRENYLTKKKKINRGEFDKYFIKEAHEPIISKGLFLKAKRIREQRLSKMKMNPNKKQYTFSGMIRCGACGRAYSHKNTSYKEVWRCSLAKKRGVKECASKQVSNNKVIEASKNILNIEHFNVDYFKSKVTWIEVMPDKLLVFHMKDASTKEYQWTQPSRKDVWTPEMKEKARIKTLNRLKGVEKDA